MANHASIEKASRDLEELYSGIPDDSVNLTFKNLADIHNNHHHQIISEPNPEKETFPLSKIPSLDFSKAFPPAVVVNQHHHHHHHRRDDVSGMSFASSVMNSPFNERGGGGRRRMGIPHSNICTVCTNYIYVCRHRCLVCGRVYCRQCVDIGMGEMTEGRKCIDCLGRRFSQRYIQRAGQTSFCFKFRYSKTIMQQELKWAEKGPRRSGEKRYDQQSVMMSRSRSPIPQATPSRAYISSPSPSSFIMSSPYSAYSPTRQPFPF